MINGIRFEYKWYDSFEIPFEISESELVELAIIDGIYNGSAIIYLERWRLNEYIEETRKECVGCPDKLKGLVGECKCDQDYPRLIAIAKFFLDYLNLNNLDETSLRLEGIQ